MTNTPTILVLAGQRPGKRDPLAEAHGVSHKCLVPICGKPLIQHVLDAIAPAPGLTEVRISIESEAIDAVRPLSGALAERGVAVTFVPSETTITDSAYALAQGVDGPFLITTGDNVNITIEAVEQMMRAIDGGADVALGLATREAVLAARSEQVSRATAHVGPYRFADAAYSNCNIYAMAGTQVLKVAETFREGGQFSKDKGRLIRAVGLFNVLLLGLRLLTLRQAMKRLSRRFGARIEAVVLADGAQAVDVDNFRTYKLAEMLLQKRAGSLKAA